MLRFVAIFVTLAVANGFSVYQMPECFSPSDFNICNQQSCLPNTQPQTVCVPSSSAGGCQGNTNAIITLLAALKNSGVITNPNTPPPTTNPLAIINLLNLLKVIIGGGGIVGGGGTLPGNGTTTPNTPLLLIDLLGGLISGDSGTNSGNNQTTLQSIVLNLLGSLASCPCNNGPCPAGTVPMTLSCAQPRCG